MITPMRKYSFLVYHKDYSKFLEDIQELGVLHIIEKKGELSEEIKDKFQTLNRIDRVVKFLMKRNIEPEQQESAEYAESGLSILEAIESKQKLLEELMQKQTTNKKEILNIEPWGDFSLETINKLKQSKLNVRLFISSTKSFKPEWQTKYNLEIINQAFGNVYFAIIQQAEDKISIEADEIKIPERTLLEVKFNFDEVVKQIEQINSDFDNYAKYAIPTLTKSRKELAQNSEYQKVYYSTEKQAENKLMVLEGWVPRPVENNLQQLLEEQGIFYLQTDPTKDCKVPILLKNNSFSRLFEPIGKLFSLPSYNELDLTPLFAPFFMMFFGFCLGDAGYGLLFIIAASLYKLKASNEIKPYLSLIQFLGLATFIFGVLSGTLFGVNLIEVDIDLLAGVKDKFLDPENMFNLALILGAIQIIFGLCVKAINQSIQHGFKYALSTIGWLVILIGGGIYYGLTSLNIIAPESTMLLYLIIGLGLFLILVFTDPSNIFASIGKGFWDIYSTVTGIFGDLLSYIRLFALGLSSAILGFVINDIALQILGSAPIIGHLFFVIFLIVGHTLNILISSLGSFVHPMRLTFVEFYKNANFAGGGKEYKPFSK